MGPDPGNHLDTLYKPAVGHSTAAVEKRSADNPEKLVFRNTSHSQQLRQRQLLKHDRCVDIMTGVNVQQLFPVHYLFTYLFMTN